MKRSAKSKKPIPVPQFLSVVETSGKRTMYASVGFNKYKKQKHILRGIVNATQAIFEFKFN